MKNGSFVNYRVVLLNKKNGQILKRFGQSTIY